MQITKIEKQDVEVLDSIICDRCGLTIPDSNGRICEALSLKVRPGYYSDYFGDENNWTLDLCEKCTYEILGPYVKYEQNREEIMENLAEKEKI